jgi:hypothetical protein
MDRGVPPRPTDRGHPAPLRGRGDGDGHRTGGTFETFRVACVNMRDGARIMTFWYAPAVRQFVRGELQAPAGLEIREMIGYKLR